MRLRLSTGFRLLFALGILLCLLALLAVPFERGKTSAQGGDRRARSEEQTRPVLDAPRRLALKQLNSQLRAGEPFSREEISILKRFAAGESITELEADTLISRSLYQRFTLGEELTRDHEILFDLYSSFAARREHDILDLKTDLSIDSSSNSLRSPNAVEVAPPNDLCAGAEVIPAAGPFPYLTAVTADITDATLTGDPPVPSCQTNVSRSVWYTFTPAATATYTISSCADSPTGSTVDDTVMAIFTSASGCAGAFTEIATVGASDGCDDDSCVTESLQAFVTTTLTSGTQYFIVMWEFDPTAPTVGNTAVQLRVSQTPAPANDVCGAATVLALNTPITGTTVGAGDDYELSAPSCFAGVGQVVSSAPGRDVAYQFTAPAAANYSFRVTNYNTSNNLVLYAASACPVGSPPILVGGCLGASNRQTASSAEEVLCLTLAASQTVYVFVDENAATAGGTFTIEATRCLAETEANGTPATANALNFGSEGSISPAGDADFFSLGTPVAGSRVFAMLDGVAASSTDFDMRVTTTVDTLEYDDLNCDVAFGSLSPSIAGTVLTGAPTFLRVNHFQVGTAAEPYRLYATVQPPSASAIAETEPNNTTGQANSNALNYFSGNLAGPAPSTDIDVFSFTATVGDLIFLSMDPDPLRDNTPINGRLELLDGGGTALLVVNDGGSTSSTTTGAGSLTATTPNSPAESIVLKALTTGTFFARVTIGTTSGTGTGAGDYLLSIFKTPAPSAANGLVSGRVVDGNGTPVTGAVIDMTGTQTRKTITDANGDYRFDRVETNGFYTVTPSRVNYNFNPFNRSFSLVGNRTDATFTGMPSADSVNPLDTPEYFVRQQYVDMLGREPDEAGFNFWSDQLLACNGDDGCMRSRRTDVAAEFFITQEFQQSGSFIYNLFKSGLGRRPVYSEYANDRRQVVGGPTLEAQKQAFAEVFVQREEFASRYATNNTAAAFVDALISNVRETSGVDLADARNTLINRYNTGANATSSRSLVLRDIAEGASVRAANYNAAFVLTEYFAYLHRNPDQQGYDFWLNVLDHGDANNYRGMVCSFITSTEYQRRFSAVVNHGNGECGL